MQKPKGTEDYYPEDMETRNKVFEIVIDMVSRYGYKEVSSPAFESMELLTRKEGEEIKEQIFSLEKRSKEEFGLKFDLTVPLTRMFIEKQKSAVKPVKWFSVDRMWRYEQPQKGRLREFYQLSVELFGAKGVYADAEIISVAIDCLKDLGLSDKDFYLKLNSRALLQAILSEFLSQDKLEAAIKIIDKRAKISAQEFNDELKEAGIDQFSKINDILDKKLEDIKGSEAILKEVENVKVLLKLLGDRKKFIQFDLSTARGLSYYTGIVFEVFDRKNNYRSILGGGRYDNLVEMFGGQQSAATGFALGYSTLLLLLSEKNLVPKIEDTVEYYIAAVSEKEMPEALKIASKLRQKSKVEVDIMGRNVGNSLKYADRIKAKKVIVIGEDELKTGRLTIRDMTTGKEKKILIKDI